MAKYKFVECNDLEQWNSFVDESPQGTIFSKSYLVEAVCDHSKYYFVKKGDVIVGGVNVLLTKEEKTLKNIAYMQYFNSILFKDNSSLLNHKRLSEEFIVSEMILFEVTTIYGEFQTINTPEFTDMRPFQWFNYHNQEQGMFDNNLNYTAILDVAGIDVGSLTQNFKTLKRREYNKSGDFCIYDSSDVSILDRLHDLTFSRQNIKRNEEEVSLLNKISEAALKNNFGRLSICNYENKPASASLFLYDNKRSYYLFGANDPEYRNTGASTKLMIDNIIDTKKRGLKEVDFVGANSPNRGDYKIGFNADIKAYYQSSVVLKK